MDRDQPQRTDLDIPEETTIELGPGDQPALSLDPDRDDTERNAASGGWDGANEQIENDFEVEQLRRAQDAAAAEPGRDVDPVINDDDESEIPPA